MNFKTKRPPLPLAIIAGFCVGLFAMLLTVGIANAAPSIQEGKTHLAVEPGTCQDCHLDITESWSHSPHAHAFDDPVFQQRWAGLGHPGDCLLCHTTNYQATNNSYSAEGVSCEACHGEVNPNHPPEIVPIRADTEYCGTCHTTTLHEWRLTGHATADVGCTDCHDPHNQKRLFEVSDELCINCHQADMERYLEDLHVQKDIGCVDCHALVIPPEVPPEDGIVPTGHTFTITPATCVACHTDALHSGFSLPGYENGASMTLTEEITATRIVESELIHESIGTNVSGLSNEQRIQALEASLANRQFTTLFQGGVIGLVLGGTTAWFVAHNTRRIPGLPAEEEKKEEEEQADGG